jgi:ATP synthase protein I
MPSPSPNNPDETPPTTSGQKNAKNSVSTPALALELPLTMAGAMFVGAAIGYFLDRWLHTKPWLTLLFGAFGFFAGIREVLRRLPASDGNHSG